MVLLMTMAVVVPNVATYVSTHPVPSSNNNSLKGQSDHDGGEETARDSSSRLWLDDSDQDPAPETYDAHRSAEGWDLGDTYTYSYEERRDKPWLRHTYSYSYEEKTALETYDTYDYGENPALYRPDDSYTYDTYDPWGTYETYGSYDEQIRKREYETAERAYWSKPPTGARATAHPVTSDPLIGVHKWVTGLTTGWVVDLTKNQASNVHSVVTYGAQRLSRLSRSLESMIDQVQNLETELLALAEDVRWSS